jgi:hypothetical protein
MNRFTLALTFVVSLTATSRADIIFDHQPYPYGGPTADTLYLDDFGRQAWELLADDITLAAPATIREADLWGFYGSSFSCNIWPPSGDETIRLRFYGSRAGDGLPGPILYEESFLNPAGAIGDILLFYNRGSCR